jgi:hypothetical protein
MDTALKADATSGFSGSSVRPIVISFSSFIPASTRWSVDYRRLSAADCHARLRGPGQSGHLVVQSRPKPRGRFDRLKFADIEITDRLQSFGEGAVLQVRRQGFCVCRGVYHQSIDADGFHSEALHHERDGQAETAPAVGWWR